MARISVDHSGKVSSRPIWQKIFKKKNRPHTLPSTRKKKKKKKKTLLLKWHSPYTIPNPWKVRIPSIAAYLKRERELTMIQVPQGCIHVSSGEKGPSCNKGIKKKFKRKNEGMFQHKIRRRFSYSLNKRRLQLRLNSCIWLCARVYK